MPTRQSVLLNKGNLKLRESSKAIVENLRHLSLSRGDTSGKYGDAPPLRSELFSAEQMKQYGRTLAGMHKVSPGSAPNQLLARLAENEDVLIGVHRLMTEAVAADRQITPAAEWLLDNFYLIEEQIRTARRHSPQSATAANSRAFPPDPPPASPASTTSRWKSSPTAMAASTPKASPVSSPPISPSPLCRWANCGPSPSCSASRSSKICAASPPVWPPTACDRNGADTWADQLIDIVENDPKNLILVIADMARSNPPMDSSFVAELTRRLQGQGPSLALPLTWIEQRLSETGWTIEQTVQSENQKQAANQVSISNSIGSLRYLSALDWRKFVEKMSVVDQILREDPDGIYGRNGVRHPRPLPPRRWKRSPNTAVRLEIEVARKAIDSPPRGGAKPSGAEARAAHVGFYLVGGRAGRSWRTPWPRRLPAAERCGRAARRSPLLYVGGIHRVITLALSALACVARLTAASRPDWLLALAAAPVRCRRQPVRRRPRELGGHPGGHARIPCRAWISPKGFPPSIEHPGGRPHHALQPRRRRLPHRSPRSALPGQSRREPLLRPAHGLRRRSTPNHAPRTTTCSARLASASKS